MHVDVITKELIQSIIDGHDADPNQRYSSLSSRIVAELQRINRITVDLAKLARESDAEAERHAQAMAGFEHRRGAIREECRHPRVTRHGDPAGGSGGFGECDLCGATL